LTTTEELADAMDQLAQAVKKVERIGYNIGDDWYERRESP
jgi:hypothetical protein